MVNRDLAVLRMILNRGRHLEKIVSAPPFPPKLGGALERCGTISEVQFDAMLAAVRTDEPWLRCLLTMAYLWGYRLMELLELRCFLVDLEKSVVYLPPRSTKNKRPRSIPVSARERALLAPLLHGKEPEDYVFTRANGKPVSDFRTRWSQLVVASGAGHYEFDGGAKRWVAAIFHDFRRTAITNMLADGVPAENGRAVVGHFSAEMTDRYNQPAMDDILRRRALEPATVPRLTNGDRMGIVAHAEVGAVTTSRS